MNKPQSQEFLLLLLLRVSFRAKHRIMRLSEQYDLTLMQAYTLILMEPGIQVPMNSISGVLNCDASNVTGIVDRLSAAGYLERKDHATDRRIKCIELTAKGVALRATFLGHLEVTDIPGLNRLNPSEIGTLKDLLQRVLED